MKIRVISQGRAFEAVLHTVVYDVTKQLQLASFAAFDTSVRAIQAAIIEGRPVQIIRNMLPPLDLQTNATEYRRLDRKASEAVVHGMIITKNAVFEHNSDTPVVLAPDGDIKKAVGKLLMARYALPKEWENQYFDLIPEDGFGQMQVITNPYNKTWSELRAVRISNKYTSEQYILEEIDKRLKDGALLVPPAPEGLPESKFDPSWDLKTYMKHNAHVLAAQLKAVRPRFVPGQDKLDPSIAKMKRVPFPAQAFAIQGVYNTLKYESTAFLSADMGCGKSIMAAGIANLIHHDKNKNKSTSVLLSAPGITIPKWASNEIKGTLPDAKVRILKNSADAGRYLREVRNGYKPDGLEFVMVSKDRAKLGPEPWCAALWKRVKKSWHYAWHCPDCFETLTVPDAESDEDTPAFWDDLAYGERPHNLTGQKNKNGIPVDYPLKWKKKSPLKKCPHCGAKLWRPALKSRGETNCKPRWYICDMLKRLGKGHFDLFINDEIHKDKAQDSGRGYAFGQMFLASKKLLGLTGTLVNGKSTSIKEILWRTEPASLIKDGFNYKTGMVSWAARYGVLKEITKVSEVDDGINTKKKRTALQPTEEPGIAPHMVARYLLHKCVFMELSDIGLPLVPIREYANFVDMDEEHGSHYRQFHDTVYDECKRSAIMGNKGAFSKFIPATINYGDRPDMGGHVVFGKGMDSKLISAPKFTGYHAKERELVLTAKAELAKGRGCVIGANYTSYYGVHRRLQQVLREHGIASEVLPSSVEPDKRVEWLAKKEEEGCKVIICNMRLVEVGLDLLPWQTIVLYQSNYDINIVRQFSRRAWRIGQDRECKVIYMVYNGTQQMAQFMNLMSKRAHAMLTEGRLDNSDLKQFGMDSQSSMAADLANCLAGTDIAQKWSELAAKDVDAGLEIVEEKDFKQVIKQRMLDLANQTRRLCGVEEVLDVPEERAEEESTSFIDKASDFVQGQMTFATMWDQIEVSATPKKTKRKKKANPNQTSLFDFGLAM